MIKKRSRQQAIMHIHKGEEIAGVWITPPIPETGFYKFMAKKKKDKTYEWAHFIQRDNGEKDRIMRGSTKNEEELELVLDIANRNLRNTFGAHIALIPAETDVRSLDGKPVSSMIH